MSGVTSNIQTQLDGKAPSGYGLGENAGAWITSVDGFDDAILNGWYQFRCTGSSINGFAFNYGALLVNAFDGFIYQMFFPAYTHLIFYRISIEYDYSAKVIIWGDWIYIPLSFSSRSIRYGSSLPTSANSGDIFFFKS